MSKYVIKDKDGNVLNHCLLADLDFVEDNYSYFEEWKPEPEPTISAAEAARSWRDVELLETDYIVPLTDHPLRESTLVFRQKLRDWPSKKTFPKTKPTL